MNEIADADRDDFANVTSKASVFRLDALDVETELGGVWRDVGVYALPGTW